MYRAALGYIGLRDLRESRGMDRYCMMNQEEELQSSKALPYIDAARIPEELRGKHVKIFDAVEAGISIDGKSRSVGAVDGNDQMRKVHAVVHLFMRNGMDIDIMEICSNSQIDPETETRDTH